MPTVRPTPRPPAIRCSSATPAPPSWRSRTRRVRRRERRLRRRLRPGHRGRRAALPGRQPGRRRHRRRTDVGRDAQQALAENGAGDDADGNGVVDPVAGGHRCRRLRPIWSPRFSISRMGVTRSAFDVRVDRVLGPITFPGSLCGRSSKERAMSTYTPKASEIERRGTSSTPTVWCSAACPPRFSAQFSVASTRRCSPRTSTPAITWSSSTPRRSSCRREGQP